MDRHYDVLIAGAGISGIAAAHYLQEQCPRKSFAILEAREALGGTWDLFRYPGIRSDSDMHTLGFSFRPWTASESIADGASILDYLRDTASEYGIDQKILFGHRVTKLRWSSSDRLWRVEVFDARTSCVETVTCNFFWACTGYYRYDRGHEPALDGRERFRGDIVHPQSWSPEVDYAGKRVVVIGSGATAMTLVPALAKTAAHVTMLQRSPSYVLSVPRTDAVGHWLKSRIPRPGAHTLVRWKNILFGMLLYQLCRRFPEQARQRLLGGVRKALGDAVDVERHFSPRYAPWDQRLCLVPDGDLFEAIRSGRVAVATDEIETLTETGIELRSGARLDADLIVTATGLELLFLGGASVEVDGRNIEIASTMMYKGMMLGGVPNAAFCLGYSNASWTLRAELTCQYVCDLLNFMDSRGYDQCCPRPDPSVERQRPLALSSGYVERALHRFPSQGSRAPWRLHQNYLLDRLSLRRASIDDGALRFLAKRSTAHSEKSRGSTLFSANHRRS